MTDGIGARTLKECIFPGMQYCINLPKMSILCNDSDVIKISF